MPLKKLALLFCLYLTLLFSAEAFWSKIFRKRQGPRERKGFYYKVKKGDNFYSLSKRFNVSEDRLKRANSIKNNILPLRTIYIPRSTYQIKPSQEHEQHPHPNKPVQRASTSKPKPKKTNSKAAESGKTYYEKDDSVPTQTPKSSSSAKKNQEFIWPVENPKVSEGGHFGVLSNDMKNSGILLDVEQKKAVKASRKGVVSYKGELQGYGKTVILDHQDKFFTIYAHLGKIDKIKQDQKVSSGQVIGYTGQSGKAKKPILHFEIRKLNEALDPMDFLPKD